MKNYIKNTLDKGEKIIVSSEVSKWSYVGPIGVGAFMFYLASTLINTGWGQISAILIILFGLYVIVSAFINRWTTEYAVTSKKVLAKSGSSRYSRQIIWIRNFGILRYRNSKSKV